MISLSGAEVSAEQAERALAEVLARPEFQEQEPGFLAELVKDFLEWLGELFSTEEAGAASEVGFQALVILLGAFGLMALILLLVEVARSRSRPAPALPLVVPAAVARRVDELRREARLAEEEGDWIRALRLYFFATVIGLGERGDLDYREAWTNRELLERGRPSSEARELLSPLARELDRHSFGERPADAAGVGVFAGACERLLGRSEG